jgi:hypothetical protein
VNSTSSTYKTPPKFYPTNYLGNKVESARILRYLFKTVIWKENHFVPYMISSKKMMACWTFFLDDIKKSKLSFHSLNHAWSNHFLDRSVDTFRSVHQILPLYVQVVNLIIRNTTDQIQVCQNSRTYWEQMHSANIPK